MLLVHLSSNDFVAVAESLTVAQWFKLVDLPGCAVVCCCMVVMVVNWMIVVGLIGVYMCVECFSSASSISLDKTVFLLRNQN